MCNSLSRGSPASEDFWKKMDTGTPMFCHNNWCAIKIAHQSRLAVTMDTTYLALSDGLMSAYCEDLGENWVHYNRPALYSLWKLESPYIIRLKSHESFYTFNKLQSQIKKICNHISTLRSLGGGSMIVFMIVLFSLSDAIIPIQCLSSDDIIPIPRYRSPVAQRPVTRSLDVCFNLHPNKRLSKQSWGWWFETLSCSLWRHRNANPTSTDKRISIQLL